MIVHCLFVCCMCLQICTSVECKCIQRLAIIHETLCTEVRVQPHDICVVFLHVVPLQ